MIFLIVGRVGSGKSHFAKKLNDLNMSFYEIKNTDTEIPNGTDVCIVPPERVEEIINDAPDTVFRLIYVNAEDIERRFNYIKSADKDHKIPLERKFSSIDEEEDTTFCDFEKVLTDKNNDWVPDNLTGIYIYSNEYSDTRAKQYAAFIQSEKETHDIMSKIVKEMANLGIITKDDNNNDFVMMTTNDGEKKRISAEYFADLLIGNEKSLSQAMLLYITKSSRFNDLHLESKEV